MINKIVWEIKISILASSSMEINVKDNYLIPENTKYIKFSFDRTYDGYYLHVNEVAKGS